MPSRPRTHALSAAADGAALAAHLESARIERLGNGLTVALLPNPQAPVVTTCLWYGAGSRDEAAAERGVAHFLEHMMFKGSAGYPAGEIDRLTQALGGSNNAFTSHDATAYYFSFARDRWRHGLAIEADRMAALTLDPQEVASERQVILEEIAMYESEPWDALDRVVQAALFGEHPYGLPVLGSRETLRESDGATLAAFHRRYYRPDNAVLVIAGDLAGDRTSGEGTEAALEAAAESLGTLQPGAEPRSAVPPPPPVESLLRLERRHGEVPRMLLALPAPAARHPDFAPLRVLLSLLASGRTSRLYRSLVDEEQTCAWVTADVSESPEAGVVSVALELVGGAEPAAVERSVLAKLRAVAERLADTAEVERAKQVLLADWVFSHERIHQQALTLGFELSLFEPGHLRREMEAAVAVCAEDLMRVAARYLEPSRGGVLGWSLPAAGRSA